MPSSVIDARDFHERRKPVARALGARAVRLNQLDNQDTTRQVVAGRHGLSYAVVGAVVDEAP